MKKNTQTNDILNFMKTHKRGITSMDAFERFGATRLSGLIFQLRKQGHAIETKYEIVKTRYGKKVEIARYILGSNN